MQSTFILVAKMSNFIEGGSGLPVILQKAKG